MRVRRTLAALCATARWPSRDGLLRHLGRLVTGPTTAAVQSIANPVHDKCHPSPARVDAVTNTTGVDIRSTVPDCTDPGNTRLLPPTPSPPRPLSANPLAQLTVVGWPPRSRQLTHERRSGACRAWPSRRRIALSVTRCG